MTRWDADTWADDSRLIRKDTEILTKESEMRDKKRKGRSQRAAGGTLKGKALVERLKRMGY
jgi:hypothetical protein